LYSIAAFNFLNLNTQNPNKQENNLNLMNKKFEVFYGEKSSKQTDDYISLKLDDIGEVAVLFDLQEFSANDYSVLDLAIANLPINYRPFLVWQVKDDPEIHQLELFQPNENIKTNLLSRDEYWKGEIVQFGVRIAPQTHLGLSIPFDKDIIIKVASLRQSHFFSDYFMLFNYWKQYNPLSYIVVNRIEANKMLPFYSQPFVFILAWMLICFLLVRMVFRQNTILVLLICCLLFLELFQINNMSKVSNWTNNVYANDMKINVDQQLYNIAMKVKSLLKLDIENTEKLNQTKVLVLSTDKYQRARIIYHMLPVNSSFLDINLEIITQSSLSPGDYILSMSLNGDPQRPNGNELIFPRKTIKVKEVWHDNIVSIMEVLK